MARRRIDECPKIDDGPATLLGRPRRAARRGAAPGERSRRIAQETFVHIAEAKHSNSATTCIRCLAAGYYMSDQGDGSVSGRGRASARIQLELSPLQHIYSRRF